LSEEANGVRRAECRQHSRMLDELRDAECGESEEPEHHHGPEYGTDARGAAALHKEQGDEDRDRDRDDVRCEYRSDDLQTFNRAEDGDRRRDHPVAVEQRRTE